jgi:hypothetical protein
MSNNKKKNQNIAMMEIAEIIDSNIDKLKTNPMELRFLKDIDVQVNKQIYPKYGNDQEVFFFRYFYCNLIEHIWFHLAGDASLRVSDAKTVFIVGSIIEGFEKMVKAIRGTDNVGVYQAYTNLIFQYFETLNSEERNDE